MGDGFARKKPRLKGFRRSFGRDIRFGSIGSSNRYGRREGGGRDADGPDGIRPRVGRLGGAGGSAGIAGGRDVQPRGG